MKILTSSAMKIAESIAVEKGTAYLDLMEQAGKGAADKIIALTEVSDKQVVVLCGKGNNGGDGLVTARYLVEAGADVTAIFTLGRELSALSRANLYELEKKSAHFLDADAPLTRRLDAIRKSDILIDAVFGTGFTGILPDVCKEISSAANNCHAIKIALDVPSGVDCDTGNFDEDTLEADYTYAFGALKPAHVLKASTSVCGKIELIDIGIASGDIAGIPDSITLIRADNAADCIPKRRADSNKGDYGQLLNIGGSSHMSGAVILSTLSAMRCGVGLVKVAAPEVMISTIGAKIVECIYSPMPTSSVGSISIDGIEQLKEDMQTATAGLLGCGMSLTDDTRLLTEEVIASMDRPLVIDADGLNCVAENPSILRKAKKPIIITPHIKEMSRLTGLSVEVIKNRRFDVAAQFAEKYNVTVVLKDSNTVIATPKREIYISSNGNSGLAKGGSGDVLAGIIASFLAQGASTLFAAVAGVYLHAAAGDMAAQTFTSYSMLPTDVIDAIPFVLKQIL
ncbi:MAG: NAD(P)H-hydrate dehydratase [Oscillospiraceae bacterium]